MAGRLIVASWHFSLRSFSMAHPSSLCLSECKESTHGSSFVMHGFTPWSSLAMLSLRWALGMVGMAFLRSESR